MYMHSVVNLLVEQFLSFYSKHAVLHVKHGERLGSTCHQKIYYEERREELCLTVFDK